MKASLPYNSWGYFVIPRATHTAAGQVSSKKYRKKKGLMRVIKPFQAFHSANVLPQAVIHLPRQFTAFDGIKQ